jgi:hypothetical protein
MSQKFKNTQIKKREELISFSQKDKKTLCMNIAPELKNKLKIIALHKDDTMTNIIEKLINEYIKKNYDLLKKPGSE